MINVPAKIYPLVLLLALIAGEAAAQARFKKGDEFQRQIFAKSNCVLQRGGQNLHVSSSSAITRAYKVTDASDRGASFNISTEKLVDTVNAMDQTMIYSTAKPADPNSGIQTGLQRLAATQISASVNAKGEVTSAHRSVAANDTLMAFAGIQPESLQPGNMLPFMIGFQYNPIFKKGYNWTVTTPSGETVYTIYAINGRTTTITYKTSLLGGNLNSRINGSMMIDNESGLILKRCSQTVSVGYEMVNGVVYTATRRTAITELCSKKQ
jgi:hypothetical protein